MFRLIFLLCAASTLTACASRPQYVAAPCPGLPVPPSALRSPLPTLDLLPPAVESVPKATNSFPQGVPKQP